MKHMHLVAFGTQFHHFIANLYDSEKPTSSSRFANRIPLCFVTMAVSFPHKLGSACFQHIRRTHRSATFEGVGQGFLQRQ